MGNFGSYDTQKPVNTTLQLKQKSFLLKTPKNVILIRNRDRE